jgi:hypothetical protein
MKYLSRNELGDLVKQLQTHREQLRKVNAKLKSDLVVLDSPSNRVYSEAEKLVMRSELRTKALGTVANGFGAENKAIGRNKAFWHEEFFDHVSLRSEGHSIADEMTERMWLSRKYELMGAGQFMDSLQKASEDGRPAEIGIARLVFESRAWKPEERSVISLSLMQAERDVVYEDRTASLELLDIASNLMEDAESSLSALRSGGDDIRLKAAPYIEQRLKKQSGAQD